MKNQFPSYREKGLDSVKKSLSPENEKIINNFLKYCRITCSSDSGIKKIKTKMLEFYDVIERPLSKINLSDLREFLAVLNNSSYALETQNDFKKVIKRFLKWYYKDWSERFNSLEDIRMKNKQSSKQNLLSPTDINKVIKGAENLRRRALLMLLWETACRPKELVNLKWKDLDLENKRVRIFSFKNNTSRPIYLNDSVIHLKRYKQEYPFDDIKEDDWLFPSPNDRKKHISPNSLTMYVNKLAKRTINKSISPYTIRHTTLNVWFNRGLKDKDYELIADHSYTTAMKYYQQSNKERLKKDMYDKVYCVEELSEEEKNKVHQLEDEIVAIKQSNEKLGDRFKQIKENYNKLFQGKNFIKIIASIVDKQKVMEQALQQIIGKKFDIVLTGYKNKI